MSTQHHAGRNNDEPDKPLSDRVYSSMSHQGLMPALRYIESQKACAPVTELDRLWFSLNAAHRNEVRRMQAEQRMRAIGAAFKE